MAQAATLQWIAEATALKMKFSELEAQLAVQSRGREDGAGNLSGGALGLGWGVASSAGA